MTFNGRNALKAAIVLFIAAVVAALYFTPARQYMTREHIGEGVSLMRGLWYGPVVIVLAYAMFVLIGVKAGSTGVLLPEQIADYGVDKATIGIMFFTGSAGFVVAGPRYPNTWYGAENRAMVDALRGLSPGEAVARLTTVFEGLLAGAGDDVLLGLAGAADADRGVLTEPVRDRLRGMLEAATAQGVAGMVGDLAGYTLADWGFTPAEVAADVLLAYGRDDALVPPAHGEWYRDRLPSADLQLWPEVGHLVVVPAWERVLHHLAG